VEQLSVPYRIGLAAVAVIGVLWFVALRPKSAPDQSAGSTPAAQTQTHAQAPGVTGLGNAVDAAKGAVSQSNASAAASEQAAQPASGDAAASTPSATTATASAGVSTAPAKTAAKPPAKPAVAADPSTAILAGLGRRGVAIVLFYNPLGADDAAVRRALRGVDRFGGRVTVHAAPIAKVGDYEAITEGVQVLQAPTLLVIGHDKHARKIVGLTDAKEIQQLVGDVGGTSFTKAQG
jgi:hypothetical protein